MQSAPLPENEASRLAALQHYEILDTPAEEGFDDLTQLAAQICGTPIALVSFVDAHRQWFKARVGIDVSETPRNIALCAHAIHSSDLFVVPDATQDERFADNPLVAADPNIRFYAGMPLATPTGHAVGTLCVIDRTPRQLTADQMNALRMLGRQVVNQLELRSHQHGLERSIAMHQKSERSKADIIRAIDHGLEGLAFLDKEGCFTYMNQAHAVIYGYRPQELIGRSWKALYAPEWIAKIEELNIPILLNVGQWSGEVQGCTKSGHKIFVTISLILSQEGHDPDHWLMCTCRDVTEHVASRQQLAAHRESLSQAQALHHIGSWEWDIETGAGIWSDEQFRIFGHEPHTITPTIETFREAIHPKDRAKVFKAFEDTLEQNHPNEVVCRIIRPRGELRYVLFRGAVTRDPEGRATRMAGTVQDVTEQKALEQIMYDTIQRLDVATKSGGIGVWDYHIIENKLVWDTQMYQLYGYTIDNFPTAYEAWNNGLHPEDKSTVEAALQAAIEGQHQFDTEFRVVLPTMAVRHIKAYAIVLKDEQGTAVKMTGINYDITAHKEIEAARLAAEATLREKEELTRATIENVIDYSIVRLDPEGHIASWNQGSQRLKGYTTDEIIGHHFSCFYTEEDQASGKPTAMLRRARAHHHAEDEGWRVRKDGTRFWANVVLTSLFDQDGRLTGFTKVLRDRTERKAAEERLERATHDLEARNRELAEANQSALSATRAKSEFLATMSHEIRTPMNAIVGMAELLQETPLTPDQANYIGRLGRAAGSLMELINAILDISKIEAGYMALESVPFDLPNLADTIAELMAGKALAKGFELLTLVHPDVPQGVVGDSTRLNQVLLNLVSNGIKFTESGHVMLTVEPARDRSTAHALRFSVSDTGIGIPQDKLQSIFEPFTQVDSTTTRKYGGTGLGLSISQHLVELMGGRLEADSTLGVGTTFSFTITLPEAPLVITSQTGRYLDLHAMRLLIVDDNETNVMIVRAHLSRSGVRLLEAPSGAQALAILDDAHKRNEPITLAILDYHMPGMNGLELAQAIRDRQEFSTLPLIMHVSELEGADARRARSLGITSYIYKPLTRGRLMDSLAAALKLEPIRPAQQELALPLIQATPAHCRILLVEDLEDNRDVIALFLKKTFYQLDMAENGAVALQKFQTGIYDLVLMDVQMPVMDGLQATAAIREWERAQQRKPTPIVALTANAFKEEADKCLAAGCTAHLTKPIKKRTLLTAIAQCADPPRDQAA
jgi:PAS domain S-box-containing protein